VTGGDKIGIMIDQVDQNVTCWAQRVIIRIMIKLVNQNVIGWVLEGQNRDHVLPKESITSPALPCLVAADHRTIQFLSLT
jgi:hypothetical protein